MSTVIHCTKIDHVTIHGLVRQYKDELSAPVLKNLRKLIIDIDGILNGEDNVTVFLYISELPEAICLKMGEGNKELHILLDEDCIHHHGTVHHGMTTFREKMNQFGAYILNKCIREACSIVLEILLSHFRSGVQSSITLFGLICEQFLSRSVPITLCN